MSKKQNPVIRTPPALQKKPTTSIIVPPKTSAPSENKQQNMPVPEASFSKPKLSEDELKAQQQRILMAKLSEKPVMNNTCNKTSILYNGIMVYSDFDCNGIAHILAPGKYSMEIGSVEIGSSEKDITVTLYENADYTGRSVVLNNPVKYSAGNMYKSVIINKANNVVEGFGNIFIKPFLLFLILLFVIYCIYKYDKIAN